MRIGLKIKRSLKKLRKKSLLYLLTIAIVITLFLIFGSEKTAIIQTGSEFIKCKVIVNDANKTRSFDLLLRPGATALDALRISLNVEVNETALGPFITCIDNVCGSNENRTYWAFYINGEYAMEGAGSYKVKNGDVISFNFTRY